MIPEGRMYTLLSARGQIGVSAAYIRELSSLGPLLCLHAG